jgi:hypothetical protein
VACLLPEIAAGCRPQIAWARNAARFSAASTCSLKTWPKCRAAWWARDSKLGKPSGTRGLPCSQAGNRVIGNAAGIDQSEVAQVGGDVEGEAVRGDAARHVNADGGDLALVTAESMGSEGLFGLTTARPIPCPAPPRSAPDAGQAWNPPGVNAKFAAQPNQRLFHPADKVHRAQAPAASERAQGAQVEDGVADQLPGTVIGHVAAAVDLMNGDAAAGEQLVGGQNVGAVARCGPA